MARAEARRGRHLLVCALAPSATPDDEALGVGVLVYLTPDDRALVVAVVVVVVAAAVVVVVVVVAAAALVASAVEHPGLVDSSSVGGSRGVDRASCRGGGW